MDFRQRVENSKGGLERLVSNIPGYHGYKEKEDRRAADKLLRDRLVADLDGQRRRLVELQRQLVEGGGLLLVDDLERAVVKVQKLMDAIRTASYGYGGLFDAVTVKEGELDALYAFDEDMLDHVSALETATDSLASVIETGEGVKEAIREVVSVAEEANTTWRRRGTAVTDMA